MSEAILFDVDGTLVDDDADWRSTVEATTRLVAERHASIDFGELLAAYYAAATQVWRTIRDARSSPWGNMDEPRIVRAVWRTALERWPAAGAEAVDHADHAAVACDFPHS